MSLQNVLGLLSALATSLPRAIDELSSVAVAVENRVDPALVPITQSVARSVDGAIGVAGTVLGGLNVGGVATVDTNAQNIANIVGHVTDLAGILASFLEASGQAAHANAVKSIITQLPTDTAITATTTA